MLGSTSCLPGTLVFPPFRLPTKPSSPSVLMNISSNCHAVHFASDKLFGLVDSGHSDIQPQTHALNSITTIRGVFIVVPHKI